MQPLRKAQETRRAFDRVRRSTCGNCPCGCGVKVFLRGDSMVDIFGDEEHPANKGSFCPKGLLEYRHLGNPDRLRWPLLRESVSQPFRRASWDEAIRFVAARLREVERQWGRDACSVYAAPASSFGHLLGGTVFAGGFGTPNGPWRFLPHHRAEGGSVAGMFGVNAASLLTNTPRDWCNSRCIIVYGCDPAATDPMAIGPIIDARDRGAAVVVIDTRTTMTAIKSSYALRARPGTLSVALRGILRLLFDEERIDREFIAEATDGVQALRQELEAYAPGDVARRCGIAEKDLRKIADVIGSAYPVQVVTGGWLGMEEMGEDDLRLCASLVCLRGSIGIPGGGPNLLNATPFDPSQWLERGGRALSGGAAVSLSEALLARGSDCGAWFFEGDPVARMAGGTAALEALSAAPLVVALGSYASLTTNRAHVVFPMASWLESDGLLAAGNGRSLQWHSRILAPPGECSTPIDFWADLAEQFDFAATLPWRGAQRDERNRAAAQWALQRNPLTSALSVEALDPERNPPGGVLWPCVDPAEIAFEDSRYIRGDVRGRNILFQRNSVYPLTERRFPTPDGLISLCGPQPREFTGTASGPESGELLLVASVPVDHVESYSGRISDRAAAEAFVTLHLHPRTAAAAGLAEGDHAVIENSQGKLRGRVRLTDTVDPQVVWCIPVPGAASSDNTLQSPWSLYPPSREPGVRAAFARVSLRAFRNSEALDP